MAFTGTLDKCIACDKTVYFVDLLSADGATFHKSCFKCSHCKGTLVMSNYSSMDGVLYCKPHFEQLFKESGNFSKNFQSSSKSERENSMTKAPNKLSALFSGTQDKCPACSKTVYPLEKCAHGGCPLTHATYAALDGVLYCKNHFAQLFMEKGNYQHVLKAATNKKNVVAPVDDDDDDNKNNNNEESAAHDDDDKKEPDDDDQKS
ncbi:LIM domain-containing protein PLIM2a [Datura stramonium]|uniref:LIM domain-containing protein PLIM2a n=1 Tax=Datura stramonium TaxID=4076 RepID=A0ABS8RQ83_DATST|nr:LIM domain-containing protein PLIM2a [Datura stramonium]